MAGFSMTEIGASLLGGGGLVQTAHWLSNRQKVRADTFKTVVDALQLRLGHTETRLDQVEDQHETCERELSEVRNRLDDSERDRAELRREIDRLMAGKVAGYKPKAPR